jgi:hypothetical protein
MKLAQMQLNFDTSQTSWLGSVVHFHPRDYFQDKLKLRLILKHESVQSEMAEFAESYLVTYVTVKDAIL